MAEGLPEGLVSTNEAVTGDIQTLQHVEVEDIKKLWQVYAANRNVLAENVGRRLENFFWRIWSSERLLHRLRGDQVATQFSSINEGGYIRTTPRSSPRSSRNLGNYYTEASSSNSTDSPSQLSSPGTSVASSVDATQAPEEISTPTPTPTSPIARYGSDSAGSTSHAAAKHSPSQEQDEDGAATPTPSSPFANMKTPTSGSKEATGSTGSTGFTRTQPAPILKKSSSTGSSRSAQSATVSSPPSDEKFSARPESAVSSSGEPSSRQASVATGSPPPRRYISTRFSEEVAVAIPKVSSSASRATERSTRQQGEGSQKYGKRNPVVIASTGASKRRPALSRQKSSQQSQSKQSPSPPSPCFTRRSTGSTPIRGLSPPAQSPRTAQPLHPFQRREVKHVSAELGPSGKGKAPQGSRSNLRPNVIDGPRGDSRSTPGLNDSNRHHHRSFTNLSTLGRKSSAVTATAASYQASGLLDFGHSSSWSSRGPGRDTFRNEIVPLKAPAPSGPELANPGPSVPLPRTKSQLTLLLGRGSASNGQDELSKAAERK
ncbi:MAG: hypothetical protein Q9163_006346 [Psora crenata]